MSKKNDKYASCSRCKLPFFSIEGCTMCFRCREDAAIINMGGVGWIGGHPEGIGCETVRETERRLALAPADDDGNCIHGVYRGEHCPGCSAELENTPAVDHETNQRCSFCQRQVIGLRIVITKAGTRWIQVAAGAWIGVNEAEDRLEVRCAGCLLPEV